MLIVAFFTSYFSSSQAWCIVGLPTSRDQQIEHSSGPGLSLSLPLNQLPGELYGAVAQCRWQFGARSTTCPFDFAKVWRVYMEVRTGRHI